MNSIPVIAWKVFVYGGVASVGLYVAYRVLVLVGLSALGFTSKGIAAGSFAASAQASVGNVSAGSWIAYLTSWGMTATSGGVQALAAAGGCLMFLLKRCFNRSK
jgi:hypothetical protein